MRQFNTPHFHIIYENSLEAIVPQLAVTCEEAYDVLTRAYGRKPTERVTFVFADSSDIHNGGTTAIPHDAVFIYVSGSSPNSSLLSIYETEDSLRRTIFHEFVHVLDLDARSGHEEVFSNIFGKVVPGDLVTTLLFYLTSSPNQMAPLWLLEGSATWAETEYVPPAGRGHSSYVEAIFRTSVRDGTLLNPNKWSPYTPAWPQGEIPYFYGLRMMQYLSEQARWEGQLSPVGRLTLNSSDRFLFNGLASFTVAGGRDWQGMAQDMLAQESQRQRSALAQLASVPITPAPRMSSEDEEVSSPIFVGDKIAFIANIEEKRTSLKLYDPREKITKVIHLRHTPNVASLALSADGRYLYYSYIDVEQMQNLYYHVNRKDLINGGEINISDRGRYQFFDVSPDGQYLLAAVQRQAQYSIVEVPLAMAGDSKHEKILVTAAYGTSLFSPKYSPDGQWISFVEAQKTHKLQLMPRQRASTISSVTTLWETDSKLLLPVWHPKGDRLVFSADKNGVYNVYELEVHPGAISNETSRDAQATNQYIAKPLTNVEGAMLSVAISHAGDKLAAVGMDGKGPYLTVMNYPNPIATSLPKIEPVWKRALPTAEVSAPLPQAAVVADRASYYLSPANMRFDFWAPWLETAFGGAGTKGGAQIYFSDPLQTSALSIVAGRDFKNDENVGFIKYDFYGLVPALSFYAAADVSPYPNLLAVSTDKGLERGDYAERARYVGITIRQPLYQSLDRQLTLTAGGERRMREALSEFRQDVNVSFIKPEVGARNTVFGTVEYSTITAFNRSVSLERGVYLSLNADRSINRDIENSAINRWVTDDAFYLPSLWDNHVIKLHGAYGRSSGDAPAQSAFGVGGFSGVFTQFGTGRLSQFEARGYDYNSEVGARMAKFGLSYRLPLWNRFIVSSDGSFPFYSRSLFGEVFYEQAKAWDKSARPDQIGWLHSAGVEVNYGMTLFRWLSIAPGLGVAYVPDNDKINKDNHQAAVYISLRGWVNP